MIVISVDCRNVVAKRIDKNSRSENPVLDTRPGNAACSGKVRSRQTKRQKTKNALIFFFFYKIINGNFFLKLQKILKKMSGAPNSSPEQKTPENLECFKVGGLFRFATFRI